MFLVCVSMFWVISSVPDATARLLLLFLASFHGVACWPGIIACCVFATFFESWFISFSCFSSFSFFLHRLLFVSPWEVSVAPSEQQQLSQCQNSNASELCCNSCKEKLSKLDVGKSQFLGMGMTAKYPYLGLC